MTFTTTKKFRAKLDSQRRISMASLQSLMGTADLMNRRLRIAFLCLVVALLGSPSLCGQVITGSVTGQVTDPSAAVVSGATVTVTNQGKGVASTAVTSDSGEYVVPLLPIGTYSVTVSKEGFRTSN